MKLEDIPRREEILILTEAHQRLDRVLVSQHFDRRVASFAEIAHVARAVQRSFRLIDAERSLERALVAREREPHRFVETERLRDCPDGR